MSKIGKKTIEIKEGVLVTLKDREIKIDGSKGSLSFIIPPGIDVEINNNLIQVKEKKRTMATQKHCLD